MSARKTSWTTTHCRHCGDKHKKLSPSPIKRWSKKSLLEALKNHIQNTNKESFSKEELSFLLKAKTSQVEHCLHLLNLEGLISQPIHMPPHDSKRDKFCLGPGDSSWCGDTYKKMLK